MNLPWVSGFFNGDATSGATNGTDGTSSESYTTYSGKTLVKIQHDKTTVVLYVETNAHDNLRFLDPLVGVLNSPGQIVFNKVGSLSSRP